MITYEQAKKIALQRNDKINACEEFLSAYRFYDEYDTTERTPDTNVVVLKDSGKVMNLTTFLLTFHPSKKGKTIPF
jgi:hypothetical protein